MEHQQLADTQNKSAEQFICRAPYLFSIPRIYEDDYPRNDRWYKQLKKIEKKAIELKNEMLEIAQRHSYLYQQTRDMIAASRERRNKPLRVNIIADEDSFSFNGKA